MKAVGLTEFGQADVLRLMDLPAPHAGPGQVRIRVRAAAVNPTDTGFRSGFTAAELAEHAPPPYVPGMDAAGVIDEVGPDARNPSGAPWLVGDQVMAIVLPYLATRGAYVEYLVVPAESVAFIPAGSGFPAASTLPMNGLTARMALDVLCLAPGQMLAVTGAAGAFGGYVVQLAKAAGLKVIADAAEADRALVEQLGADIVLPRGPEFAAAVRAVEPSGADAVADGAVLNAAILPAVKDGGALASIRNWTPDEHAAARGVRVHLVRVREYAREQQKLAALSELAAAGVISLRVAQTMPAAQAAAAHRRLEAGGVRGRLVLEF
jgi:NADPH:quinone reductase-like Zn-dependent oxidoreductase